MRLFRRRRDRSEPVPAPPGTKWVLSKSILAEDGRPLHALGLWDEHLEPNEWGVVVGEPGVIALDKLPLAMVHFDLTKRGAVHVASLEALARYGQRLRAERLFTETRTKIQNRQSVIITRSHE